MIVFVFATLLAAGAIAAAVFISKDALWNRGLVVFLCVALSASVAVAFAGVNLVQLYYRPPAGAFAALAGGVLAAVALFAAIGNGVAWKPPRVLALMGLVAATFFAMFLAAMVVVPGMPWLQDALRARTVQIAKDQGFTALLPEGHAFETGDSLPVDVIADAKDGLQIGYYDFDMQERRLAKPRTEAELLALVAPGSMPWGAEGPKIPRDARIATVSVAGEPGVVAEYTWTREPGRKGTTPEPAAVLVTQADGVDVRLAARPVPVKERLDGPVYILKATDLVRIAESLKPIAAP